MPDQRFGWATREPLADSAHRGRAQHDTGGFARVGETPEYDAEYSGAVSEAADGAGFGLSVLR